MYESAFDIINDALIEVGLNESVDPFADQDAAVIQIRRLLTTCSRELVKMHPWEWLQREWAFTTQAGDTGKYDLPSDFGRMIDQAGWSRDQRVPLPGSITPQIWAYLKGRNLVSSTIYLVFRQTEGELWLYPQPPDAAVPAPLTVAFQYMSRCFAQDADSVGGTPVYIDRVAKSGDIIFFDPILVKNFLKLRFKEARGIDTGSAQTEFAQMFSAVTGQNVASDSLNVANMSHPYPYLDLWRNTPDTGYGM